ncbi:MAG: NAD-dependent epimerase/dehydratase family protein [Holophagales bacterium]|nr:NAD-dependent epimerase/dehydratase family protein [Holophagales bacterium]
MLAFVANEPESASERPRTRQAGVDLSPGPVFVTGGTGFVGGRLVASLLARGRSVRGLARPTSERAAGAERLEWVEGDILDRDSLRRAVAGCTEVFHLAAYARNWAKDPSTFFRLNVEGTRNVFEAAAEAGVRRIVYTSTVVVFGPTSEVSSGTRRRRGDAPFSHGVRRDQVRRREGGSGAGCPGIPIVVVHPTRVYGPGKRTEGTRSPLMIDDYGPREVPGRPRPGRERRELRVRGRPRRRSPPCDGEGADRGAVHPRRRERLALGPPSARGRTDGKEAHPDRPAEAGRDVVREPGEAQGRVVRSLPQDHARVGGDVPGGLGLLQREGRARARLPDHSPPGGPPAGPSNGCSPGSAR